jgi:hypothetical protein
VETFDPGNPSHRRIVFAAFENADAFGAGRSRSAREALDFQGVWVDPAVWDAAVWDLNTEHDRTRRR